MPIFIPDEVLKYLSEEELDEYVEYLTTEIEGGKRETGEWSLQPRQQFAEDCLTNLEAGSAHELLYGGAVGGGKTDFMLWHLHDHALRYPRFSGIYLRRTFPQLRRSAILRSLERFNRDRCRYIASEYTWKFDNDSRIEFGFCETEFDAHNYQSAEYDVVCWDELTEFPTDYAYLYLFSRLRTSLEKRLRGLVPHVIAATNPGGVGGAWVKERFVDVAPPEERVHMTDDRGNKSTRVFIPAKLPDNKYLGSDEYRASLAHLPDDLREALEEGSWDVIVGQYFPEWKRDLHVIKPFVIPPWWTMLRGIDYGFASPFACLSAAFDPDGTGFVFREQYGPGLTPPQQAKAIKDGIRPGDPPAKANIIDPSTFAKTGVGVPIAQQYQLAGLPVVRGLNARVAGWQRVREMLRPSVESVNEDRTITMKPRLFVFEGAAQNLVRTLPLLVRDIDNPEDCDSDGEDHAPDALRYLVMARPQRPRKPEAEAITLDERRAKYHRDRERERRREAKGQIDHPVLGRI